MKLSTENKVTLGFVFALVMLSVIGVVSYYSVVQLYNDAASVKRAQEIITYLESLLSTMTDAETGSRGYTITGDERFLEPYHNALSGSDADLRQLRQLIADPAQQERLEAIVPLIAKRLEILHLIVDLRERQGFEAAQSQILTGGGIQLHDRIRRLIGDMIDTEKIILEKRDLKTSQTVTFTQAIIIVGGMFAFAITGLSLFLIRRDITERKRGEAALQEANTTLMRQATELTTARDRAESADRLKSAFLAMMSHELRTPLNSIIGFTGIILQGLTGPLNPEQSRQLGMVQNSARHLLALINDVLDISKIEAGELKVSCEPFDLHASIEKVAAIVKPHAEKKGLALRAEVAPEIGTLVSDPRRVEQVLLNLLNNAIKFTDHGGVTLRADVVTPPSGQALRVQVVDTGSGIKPEDADRLFKPFQQVNDGLARPHEGTGLGLAICKKLLNLLGGDISMHSEWGKGSTFAFTLPMAPSGRPEGAS